MAALKEEEESLHIITHSGIQKSMYNLAMRSKLNISPSITKAIDDALPIPGMGVFFSKVIVG